MGIAMHTLVEKYESRIKKIRFWGKIFGKEEDYYIIETEMEQVEEEGILENEKLKSTANGLDPSKIDEVDAEEIQDQDKDDEPKLPVSEYKRPLAIPSETNIGANKFSYFYCNNDLLIDWKQMPQVQPKDIQCSRNIKKYFTGNPEHSFQYNGQATIELNILRAQIARISSATQVSPQGFFTSNDQKDSEDESEGVSEEDNDDVINKLNCIENVDFEEIPLSELCDTSLTNWVHHMAYILPQGRCTWWNPNQIEKKAGNGDGEDEMENSEEKSEPNDSENALIENNIRPEPEVGPPLLSALTEDLPLNGCPAWNIVLKSSDPNQNLELDLSYCNLNFGQELMHLQNQVADGILIYVGWGIKYEGGQGFSPVTISQPMSEYVAGKDTQEVDDPSIEDEIAQKAKEDENAIEDEKESKTADKESKNNSDEEEGSD